MELAFILNTANIIILVFTFASNFENLNNVQHSLFIDEIWIPTKQTKLMQQTIQWVNCVVMFAFAALKHI
jgi:hypothetical protein